MSSEEGTEIRSGKIFELATNSQSVVPATMSEPNTAETESVRDSSVSSQLAEIKDYYERKCNELQSKIGQLKELMIAMIGKSYRSGADAQGQDSWKQPVRRSDIQLEEIMLLHEWKKNGTDKTFYSSKT